MITEHPTRTERARSARNIAALIGDFLFFSIGFAFYDPLVLVPAFVQEFIGSDLLIGLLSAIRVLMTTLPQVWAASVLISRRRMKPLLIASSVGGRLPIALLALAVYLWADEHIALVGWVLGLSVTFFYISEGLNSVAWPSLVGKVVPERIRGRFFGLGQFLSSLGAAGAGYWVNRTLDRGDLALPTRWSLIFAAAFVALMLSAGAMVFIRERAEDTPTSKPDMRKSLRRMRTTIRSDASLRRVVAIQLLIYTASATFAFFVVRARQILPDGGAVVGTFLTIQSIGSMVAAPLGGMVIDRIGSWAAIRMVAFVETLALVVVTLAGLLPYPLVLYGAAFFLMGFVNGTSWWSFNAYILDMAPEDLRPVYLATTGVFGSLIALSPVAAGALFNLWTPEWLFAAAAGLALMGLMVAWRLRKGSGSPEHPNLAGV